MAEIYALSALVISIFILLFLIHFARRLRNLEGRVMELEIASEIRVGETTENVTSPDSELLSRIHVGATS